MGIIHFYFSFIFLRQKVPSAATLQLHSFQFDDFSLKDTDMLKVNSKTVFTFFTSLFIMLGIYAHVHRP